MRVKSVAIFIFAILPLTIIASGNPSINLSKEDDRLLRGEGYYLLCGVRLDGPSFAFIICSVAVIIATIIVLIVKRDSLNALK
jgi:hypothetical protein